MVSKDGKEAIRQEITGGLYDVEARGREWAAGQTRNHGNQVVSIHSELWVTEMVIECRSCV